MSTAQTGLKNRIVRDIKIRACVSVCFCTVCEMILCVSL